jgi:hypothetical protein
MENHSLDYIIDGGKNRHLHLLFDFELDDFNDAFNDVLRGYFLGIGVEPFTIVHFVLFFV